MRAFLYTRISADHIGAGLGVERQLEDCQKLADHRGFEVIRVYSDNDISAMGLKPRPEYLEMLAALRRGEANVVVVWHTDRLHRNVAELEEFIEVALKHNIPVHTVTASDVDLTTSQGRLNARLGCAIARAEVEHSRERMIRAHEQAAINGKWRARRRVFGWVQGGSELVPEEADAIRKAVTAILSGVSLRQVAREWNEAGLQTTGSAAKFDASAVRDIISSPRAAGLQEYKGKVVGKGEWPAIIELADHEAIKALLANPARARRLSYERRHIGSGVYRCGRCSAPMSMTHAADGVKHYRCSASAHLSRQGEALDAYIDALVLGRLSRPDAALVLDTPEVDLPALQLRRDGLQERLDQLADLFATGDIDGSQLKRGTETLRGKIEVLDRQLADARMTSPLADLVLSGDKLAEVWEKKSADVRGKIIAALMDVVVKPSPRGQRRFNPDYIEITWKV